MLTFTVVLPNGKSVQHQLETGSYIIGRGLTSDVRVADKSISRQHAIVDVYPDRQHIRSAGIGCELQVNGDQTTAYGPLRPDDLVTLGGSRIQIISSTVLPAIEPLETEKETDRTEETDTVFASSDDKKPVDGSPGTRQGSTSLAEKVSADSRLEESTTATQQERNAMKRYAELTPVRCAIQEQVQTQLDLHKRNLISEMSAHELRTEATRMAEQIVSQKTVEIPADVNLRILIEEVVAESIGLGPIEPLLEDEGISEIMINGPEHVYVERDGKISKVSTQFISVRSLMSAIERIVTPLGRRIDEGVPMVDARLADGSRVNAIIPPLSLKGPILTIRKFSKTRFDMQKLVEIGSLSPQMAEFLLICVLQRKNIVISGGTGSGKTTFLNALSDAIPDSERIVTIEDAAELRLSQQHVISLEARPPNVEGVGQVSIRDLVRNSLRMRPDRIVVGECRGGEALDMLQAMNTGHDGSLTTGHANTPRDLLSRLEVMVLMSGMELPIRAIREQISSAVDIVVQQSRFKDGKRRVTDIVEVDGMEGDVVLLQKLFEFKQSGVGQDGVVQGEYVGLENAPNFYSELETAGLSMDRNIFNGSWNPDPAMRVA